jgi:hypothetical protein
MGPVADEVAATVDALDAELLDALECCMQRRKVGMNVCDDRGRRDRRTLSIDKYRFNR